MSVPNMSNVTGYNDSCANGLMFFGHPLPNSGSLFYVVLAVAHIVLIVLPAVALGTGALVYLSSSHINKHPTVYVLRWICVVSILCPSTYGLLMDISLLTDLPILGTCGVRGVIPWMSHTFCETFVMWLTALIAFQIYSSVKTKPNAHFKKRVNLLLIATLLVCLLESLLVNIPSMVLSESQCHVQGSFCVVTYEKPRIIFLADAVRVIFAISSTKVSAFFLYHYSRTVKKCVLVVDAALLTSMVNVVVSISVAHFFFAVPTAVVYFLDFDGRRRGFIQLLCLYYLQFNYVAFIVLTFVLQKTFRDFTKKAFAILTSRCSKNYSNRIVPADTIAHQL